MTHIYITSAVLLTILFETIRIKIQHGKVVNIDKGWTKAIAVLFFVVAFVLSSPWHWGFYAILAMPIMYLGCRYTLYDPLLNVLALKRGLFADSKTTNSKQDHLEQLAGISTYHQRVIGLAIWIVGVLLYELAKHSY